MAFGNGLSRLLLTVFSFNPKSFPARQVSALPTS
jgi:hypothetical protein